MADDSRRRLLQAAGWASIGLLSGCTSLQAPSGPESPQSPTDTTGTTDSLTDWERSTDCDSMHDSVIKVERVRTTIPDNHSPIQFVDLSAGEQSILQTVTEEGGYGTCDTADDFEHFLDRVQDHLDRQNQGDMQVYLERNGTYYQLYVEDLDRVYAY